MSWSERECLSTRINRLFEEANGIDNDKLKSDLARYICVLASGYLEVSCRDIFGTFAERQASPAVLRFVSQQLKKYSNLNTEKFLQLAESFVPECRQRIESDRNFEELKDAVDSIVSNRNNIAHGRDTGISLSVVKRYYEKAKRFLELLKTSLTCSASTK